MAEELVSRRQKFKLSEEEGRAIGIKVAEGGSSSSSAAYRLVGCLITTRPYNHNALGRTMRRIWRPQKGVEFKKLGENVILFEFMNKKDHDRVLLGRPWAFDKYLLIIQEYDGSKRPSDLTFTHSAFWIRILDVPLQFMTKEVGESIGATLGWVLEVDSDKHEMAQGECLRVKIDVDVRKPLRRGIFLKLPNQEDPQCFFLSNMNDSQTFCYGCGLLGHVLDECEVHESVSSLESQYGDW